MYNPLHFASLTASQFVDFLFRILTILKLSDLPKLKIKKRFDILNAIFNELNDALKREQALAESKEIEALDKRRDRAIRGLMKLIEALILSNKVNIAEAALLLQNFLKNLSPNIAKEDFATESSVLRKFYEAYQNDAKIKAAVITIGAQDWLTEINDANTAFETKYAARTIVITTNNNKQSFSELRPKALEAYKSVLKIIDSRYDVTLDEGVDGTEYLNLINQINATIDQAEQIIKSTQPHTKPTTPPTTNI